MMPALHSMGPRREEATAGRPAGSRTIYWGWCIVGAAFLTMGINYGSRYCFGIFVRPIALDLEWSRSVISVGASLMILSYATGGIVSGRLLDRMAPRWLITLGACALGAGFLLMSVVRTPLQFNLVYGILCGAGASFFGVVVCNSYVGKWFVRKRGVAIGIASIGIGAATMVLPFIAGFAVKEYGWRAGFAVLGVLVLLVAIPLAQLFMGRTRPEDYGLAPDGEAPTAVSAGVEGGGSRPVSAPAVSYSRFLRDSRFWTLAFCFSIAVMAEMLAFVHQVAYATDQGIERLRADASLSLIGLGSIAGRYFFGWISDRIRDAKYSACGGFAAMALGIVVLMQFRTLYGLYGYALCFGFGYGSIATLMPYLLADRFGARVLGTAYGMLTFFVVAAGSLGPLLGGFIYDRTGSYDFAWKLCLALLAMISLVVITLKGRREPL